MTDDHVDFEAEGKAVNDQHWRESPAYIAMMGVKRGYELAQATPPTIDAQERREALEQALAWAYIKGAEDVHAYWKAYPGEAPRGDQEFDEAASDYAKAALDPYSSAARVPDALLAASSGEREKALEAAKPFADLMAWIADNHPRFLNPAEEVQIENWPYTLGIGQIMAVAALLPTPATVEEPKV